MLVGLSLALPDGAQAQLSPEGIFNSLTRPFRHMFRHFGHPRHERRRRAASAEELPDNKPLSLGPVGPPAWPSAYEEMLGVVFWQNDYATRLHARGFGVIADTITGHYKIPHASVRSATNGDGPAGDSCDHAVAAQDDWPSARIEQVITLSDAQKAALGQLQAAILESVKSIEIDCGHDMPASPDRLRLLVRSLWSVRDAGIFDRAPLEGFYETLTQAQKDELTKQGPYQASADSKKANARADESPQACASRNAESAERLIKTIRERVRPNKEQAESLEALHKTSAGMAKLLTASCMRSIAADPLPRLDAAINQVTTINYAATTVEIAFNDFYIKLDSRQKARLDSLGR
jgi:hypothetical protein